MEPIIKTLIATLSMACAAAAHLYSPMLLITIVMRSDDWRMQLLRPQIDQVPPELRDLAALAFLLLTVLMYVDVCAAFAEFRPVILAGCVVGFATVTGYWFFMGHML